jgi:hypothetical protein
MPGAQEKPRPEGRGLKPVCCLGSKAPAQGGKAGDGKPSRIEYSKNVSETQPWVSTVKASYLIAFSACYSMILHIFIYKIHTLKALTASLFVASSGVGQAVDDARAHHARGYLIDRSKCKKVFCKS